ncbi:uncharacterized protein LOC127279959 [Leptopilina boulardi]|uniref:uncharacterized protein LOC127279959 n=1 Tax=Leptopilina boulardi TaxID=63433 RepID=UPI0021F5FF5A|nr:uncharacterized protein LOC127279959 [Leptopilina boulardi]
MEEEYEQSGTVISPNRTKSRPKIIQKLDELQKTLIRRKVHAFYVNKELPTLDKLKAVLDDEEEFPKLCRSSIHSVLKELKFTYQKRKRNSVLLERNDLVLWPREYLEKIRKYCEEGKTIYFLDETWINVGDVSSRAWYDETIVSGRQAFLRGLTTGPPNPTGKGKRIIVLHIGSDKGFVEEGLLFFESKKNSMDFHDEMNGENFKEWFENIITKLEDDCVIVMDNAPYHSVKVEKVPISTWKKVDIQNWLKEKGLNYDETMIKAQLLNIVKGVKKQYNSYVIDEIAKKNNKIILRLPPYHCELNPIEMVWSMVKGYVKSNNFTFKLEDVKKLLLEGINRVTSENWQSCVRHVIREEEKFWNIDHRIDELVDRIPAIVINVSVDSSSESE